MITKYYPENLDLQYTAYCKLLKRWTVHGEYASHWKYNLLMLLQTA